MALTENRGFDTKKYLIIFGVMFGLIFVRYCYFGFEYFLQLDDYIQYHNYTVFNEDLGALIKKLSLLATRPLAGLADLFVWSKFYGGMIWAVAVISAMYSAAAVLFHKAFSRYFGIGWFYFVIFALLPLGFEGVYWVSASSRIVVGMFFAALSLLFFDKWCTEARKSGLVLFAVLQFVGFCFYEQIILLSGGATIVLMLMNYKQNRGRALWGFLMFAGAALYFAGTRYFAGGGGVYGGRTEFFLPWQEGWWLHGAGPAGKQMLEVFGTGMWATLSRGLVRGFGLLSSAPNILWCVVVLGLCAVLFFIAKKTKRVSVRFKTEFFAGLFLFIAPLLLFFLIRSPWFCVRNAVPSFVGLALMADAVLGLVLGRVKRGAVIEAAVASAVALLLCIASVSELHDYRQTTLADTEITRAAWEVLEDAELKEDRPVWLMNVDASYAENANFYFNEHGHGITASDWALTGAIRAISGDGDLQMITPVSVHRPVTLAEGESLEDVVSFMYAGGSFTAVELRPNGEGEWLAVDSEGRALGMLTGTDGKNYMLSMK